MPQPRSENSRNRERYDNSGIGSPYDDLLNTTLRSSTLQSRTDPRTGTQANPSYSGGGSGGSGAGLPLGGGANAGAGQGTVTGATGAAEGGFWASTLGKTLLALGLNAAGSAFAPDPFQKRNSFKGTGPFSDPVTMLQNANQGIARAGQGLSDQLEKPRTTSAIAQPVPGLSGMDPAYTDPSILTKKGVSLKNPFNNVGGGTDNPAMGGQYDQSIEQARQLLQQLMAAQKGTRNG